MHRRQFLGALGTAAALPVLPVIARAQSGGARTRITRLRVVPLKVLREVGQVDPSGIVEGFPPRMTVTIGGGSIVEIHTDDDLVGIGPGIDASLGPRLAEILEGQDPFDIAIHASRLARFGRGGASVEIALWDLIGKLAEQPLYKLWGGGDGRVIPYSSCFMQGGIAERVAFAERIADEGWKAIKLRTSYPTLGEDIKIVADVRAVCGDDFDILTDANKGGLPGPPVTTWDFQRAIDTALAYQEMGVYWLEEPLDRFDFDGLAELNSRVDIPIAGAENNVGTHEFRWMLERHCFDFLNPEVMLMGPTALRQIASLASAFNVGVVPHLGDRRLGTICAMHLVASMPNTPYMEIINDPPIMDYRHNFAIMENPPTLQTDGTMIVPSAPGLGVTIDPDMLEA